MLPYLRIVGYSSTPRPTWSHTQQSDEAEHQIVDHHLASDEWFQINYREEAETARDPFVRWLDHSLREGLEIWRRSEGGGG